MSNVGVSQAREDGKGPVPTRAPAHWPMSTSKLTKTTQFPRFARAGVHLGERQAEPDCVQELRLIHLDTYARNGMNETNEMHALSRFELHAEFAIGCSWRD